MEPTVEYLTSSVKKSLTEKVLAFSHLLSSQMEGKVTSADILKVWNDTTDMPIDPKLLETKVVMPTHASSVSTASTLSSVKPPPTTDKCQYVFKKGARVNEKCEKKTTAGEFCSTHYKPVSPLQSSGSAVGAVSGAGAVASASAGGNGGELDNLIHMAQEAKNITALKKVASCSTNKEYKLPGYTKYSKDQVEELRSKLIEFFSGKK